jgi:hypothetical protein
MAVDVAKLNEFTGGFGADPGTVPGFLEMSAVLARRIPGAEYRVVAGAGHMVNMEQPAAVNELLARFLDGLAPTGTPAGKEHGQWSQ